MSDNKIKPCPFCGKEPKILEGFNDHFQVHCLNDNCYVQPSTLLYADGNGETAILKWNERYNE